MRSLRSLRGELNLGDEDIALLQLNAYTSIMVWVKLTRSIR